MRIRGKLIAGLAAVAVLTAGVAGYAALSLQTVGGLTERLYDGPLMATDFAASSLTQFVKLDRTVSRAVEERRKGGAAPDIAALKSLESDIADSLAIVEERAQDASVSSRIGEIKGLLTRWASLRERLLGGSADVPGSQLTEKQELFNAIEKQLDIVNEAAKEQGYYFRQDARRVVENALIALLAVAAVAAALAIGLALLLARNIGRPVAAMASAMTKLAGGDKDVEIPGTNRKDEVGDMAGALVFFKDAVDRSEALAAEQRAEQSRKEARQKSIETSIQGFDSSVSGALSAFGSATDDLKTTAQSMAGVARETGRQAGAAASASEEASANVQAVAAAAEELSASSAEISRRVAETAQIASQAVTEAGQTNSRVERLTEAAQKIGDVVKLINDIASQTNLLALNATIEAARAGEAGKGFAVVASEVKSLATQTAKATEDIAAQVEAIRGATGDAAQAIRAIGVTIGRVSEIATSIASAVEEQGAATREIARNVQQASAGTSDVSANIAGVTQSVGQTGESAARVLSATGALVSQSDTLRVEVNEFLAKIRAA